MSMKKLQNNFTTPEQSNRLLELGVPADSADCYRTAYGTITPWDEENELKWYTGVNRPCWSVGRLIELHEILFPQYKNFIIERDDVTLISRMVKYYEIGAKQGALDFSKLEE